jgi:hypothetical protein
MEGQWVRVAGKEMWRPEQMGRDPVKVGGEKEMEECMVKGNLGSGRALIFTVDGWWDVEIGCEAERLSENKMT